MKEKKLPALLEFFVFSPRKSYPCISSLLALPLLLLEVENIAPGVLQRKRPSRKGILCLFLQRLGRPMHCLEQNSKRNLQKEMITLMDFWCVTTPRVACFHFKMFLFIEKEPVSSDIIRIPWHVVELDEKISFWVIHWLPAFSLTNIHYFPELPPLTEIPVSKFEKTQFFRQLQETWPALDIGREFDISNLEANGISSILPLIWGIPEKRREAICIFRVDILRQIWGNSEFAIGWSTVGS